MWTWLKDACFWCMEAVYNFCGDWGLAIIIITLIFRLLISPITAKQTKSTYAMQKLQPKIKEIQQKYAGDQQRMNEEMQKVYAESKFNPLGGCLPLLLQMPIFIILYQTLLEKLPEGSTFYSIIPDLTQSVSGTVGGSAEAMFAAMPYIILLVLFVASTFIPMLMQGNKEKQTMIMSALMSLFMLYIGYRAPAGVILYWVVSSFFGVAQQTILRKSLKKKDERRQEEEDKLPEKAYEPVEVNVTRRAKKAKPTKKR